MQFKIKIHLTGCAVCLRRMVALSSLSTEQVSKLFVEFNTLIGVSGRQVLLSSKSFKQGKYFWSAGIVIDINSDFTWKFLGDSFSNIINKIIDCLGDSSSIFEDYFLLLPESYNSARSNQLQFLAEYVDEGSGDMEITFNEEVRL